MDSFSGKVDNKKDQLLELHSTRLTLPDSGKVGMSDVWDLL